MKKGQSVNENDIKNQVAEAARKVRETNPLAGSVTNAVTMDFVANAQLAVGGSAAMVYFEDEGEFLVQAGGATYVNMGTLLPVHEKTIPAIAAQSAKLGKPWIIDPVGIGIGALRTRILKEVKPYKPSVVRCNASEAIALAGIWDVLGAADETSRVRGVDSTDTVTAARQAAIALARYTGHAVAVSGEEDLVTDGKLVARSTGGSPLMEKVTGFGCSLGGVVAVYACVADPFIAALAAVAHYNLAATRAAKTCDAPGSFKVAFLDELYRATPEDIAANPFTLEEA